LIKFYYDFHSGCTSFYSYKRHIRVSFSPYYCQQLLFVILVIANLTGVRWNLSVVLFCISFMAKNTEHFSIYLLVVSTSEYSLSNSFVHLLIRLFILLMFYFLSSCYAEYESFIHWIVSKHFLPFIGLSLDSGNCFLW
jgi:hypothetical protein